MSGLKDSHTNREFWGCQKSNDMWFKSSMTILSNSVSYHLMAEVVLLFGTMIQSKALTLPNKAAISHYIYNLRNPY